MPQSTPVALPADLLGLSSALQSLIPRVVSVCFTFQFVAHGLLIEVSADEDLVELANALGARVRKVTHGDRTWIECAAVVGHTHITAFGPRVDVGMETPWRPTDRSAP